jgi:small subunit ribosomal protein S7
MQNRIQISNEYSSLLVQTTIHHILKHGKKVLATNLLVKALKQLDESKESQLEVLHLAVHNATPTVEVKPKRFGGSVYQVPITVTDTRGTSLAIRWILHAALQRDGSCYEDKLAKELQDAAQNIGSAIRKKEEVERMAQANKAFAHLA